MNKKYLIEPNTTLIDALKYMDNNECKSLIICDGEKFLGLISIGDIQRAIINKDDLQDEVTSHIRSDIIYATTKDKIEDIKRLMQEKRIECMPVVDDEDNLVDIIEWDSILSVKNLRPVRCPVVVMAGGKGQRLRPLTNIIPKPLVPISQKTIIEEIMDRFVDVDCHDFYISVNYMGDVIKNYFSNLNNENYSISYLEEEKPLGTAGSLYLIKDKMKGTFFVSNCDILVDVDLADLLEYHKSNKNVATIVSVLKNYKIPYGTLETKEDGLLTSLIEKPTFSYQINSGLYVLEPEIFEYMENDEFIHITDLFERIIKDGNKIGVFPVSEGSWTDMGNWDEYLKIVNRE